MAGFPPADPTSFDMTTSDNEMLAIWQGKDSSNAHSGALHENCEVKTAMPNSSSILPSIQTRELLDAGEEDRDQSEATYRVRMEIGAKPSKQ